MPATSYRIIGTSRPIPNDISEITTAVMARKIRDNPRAEPGYRQANAKWTVIAGRNAEKFKSTKQELLGINPNLEVLVIPTDTSSECDFNSLQEVICARIGVVDILVNGAGWWSSTEKIGNNTPKEWWADFSIPPDGRLRRAAILVNVNTWDMLTTVRSYRGGISERLFSMDYHPGMTKTEIADRPEVLHFCEDTVELAAGTAGYLASPQTRLLSGKYMPTNWDVNELGARKSEIVNHDFLKTDLRGELGGPDQTRS